MSKDFWSTVANARNGDPAAFNELFTRNLPPLMAYLHLRAGDVVGPRESVQDLAQSVCREVLADLDGFEYRGEKAFRKYLYLHAARKIFSRKRYYQSARRDPASGGRSRIVQGDDAGTLLRCYASLCTPSRQVCAREELGRVESALEQLPASQREAVALSRLMDFSNAEIAAQLGISESAVRGLLARGLARLSTILELAS